VARAVGLGGVDGRFGGARAVDLGKQGRREVKGAGQGLRAM
jgi:hypothetical protein